MSRSTAAPSMSHPPLIFGCMKTMSDSPHRSSLAVIAAAALVLMSVATPAHATTVTYAVTNLGGSLWRYDYVLTNVTFQADQGFAVFFDSSLYANLQTVPPAPSGWDPLVEQPNVALTSAG